MARVRGAARNGPELLAGLLRCSHYDRRIQVRDGGKAIVYRRLGLKDRESASCISFGAVGVDAAVGAAVLQALEPLGNELALAAWSAHRHEDDAAVWLAQSALTETRYRAETAGAQFQAVEPADRNVFHNLARRWETCLSRVSSDTRIYGAALRVRTASTRSRVPGSGSGATSGCRRSCASVSSGRWWWRSSPPSGAERSICCCAGRAAAKRTWRCPRTASASTSPLDGIKHCPPEITPMSCGRHLSGRTRP